MEEQDHIELIQKPGEVLGKTSWQRTVISLILFIVADYWLFQSWTAVLILVSVIFIHELGHFLAMKLYGYESVNMTFIPIVGAYVSGQAIDLSKKNKLVVLLAGPVPGIIIGCILFYIHQHNHDPLYFKIAFPFLALNVFNLLPVFPLDGGQFFQVLFFYGSRILQLIFLYFSLAAMVYLAIELENGWFFWFLAFYVLLRIMRLQQNYRVRKKLDELGIDYACTYDELTDEQYWSIRNTIIIESKILSRQYDLDTPSINEHRMVARVEAVLVQAYHDDLDLKLKIVFCLVWTIVFVTPIVQWLLYKNII